MARAGCTGRPIPPTCGPPSSGSPCRCRQLRAQKRRATHDDMVQDNVSYIIQYYILRTTRSLQLQYSHALALYSHYIVFELTAELITRTSYCKCDVIQCNAMLQVEDRGNERNGTHAQAQTSQTHVRTFVRDFPCHLEKPHVVSASVRAFVTLPGVVIGVGAARF